MVIYNLYNLKISHTEAVDVTKIIGCLKKIYEELHIFRGKTHE